MNNIFRNLLFAGILILFISAVPGCIKHSPESPAINISGKWKIINEDNLKFSKPEYDDSNADVIDIPGNWMNFIQKNESMTTLLWLRKAVYIDNSFSNSELILELGKISVAEEVYFNGCFIGGTGGMPKGDKTIDYRFAWQTPRYYLLPKFLIKFNQTNIISIRVFSHVINGVTGNLKISEIWNEYPYRLRDLMPVMINYFSIIINMFFFFLLFIQYFYDRSRLLFLYLALTALSDIILSLCVVNIPFYISGMIRYKALFIAYSSINVFMALFMQELFNRRYKHSTLLLLLFYCLSITIILLPQTTRVYIGYTRIAVTIFAFACQLYAITGLLLSVIKNLNKYWLFLFIVPVVLSTLRNAYYILNMNYDAIYISIFLHVPIIITIFILFLFYDFDSQKRINETIFQSMRRKAQRLQYNLSKSKQTNAKLQPNEIIYNLIEYIDINFTKTYNRAELSRQFGLNENYMLQLFKKTTGKTISNYINTKRIDKSIEMMGEKDIKMIDIAYNIGFENYNFFHRLFKQKTGMSPGLFRKTYINK